LIKPIAPPLTMTRPAMAAGRWPYQRGVVALACWLGLALTLEAALHVEGLRGAALSLLGIALGLALLQSNFGFAGSFRAALERNDYTGFRAQAVALALTSTAFFPLMALGSLFGQPLNGFVAPVGISFILGAILFGIGMQIGGGCASGTLFALGGGDARLLLTLAFFVLGSAAGAAHLDYWHQLPAFPATTTQDVIGWPLALLCHLSIFGAIIWSIPEQSNIKQGTHDLPRSPWTMTQGAIALAALNTLTLIVAGRPWGETAGFTLWGSKIAQALGFDAASWPYWRGDPSALSRSLFDDMTTVMDFGILIGAAMAAGLSHRFELRTAGGIRAGLGACIGGCLMGYGARMSDGCNIGAYFSALASGSLSGWVWVAAAFAGSAVGLRLRPLFVAAHNPKG